MSPQLGRTAQGRSRPIPRSRESEGWDSAVRRARHERPGQTEAEPPPPPSLLAPAPWELSARIGFHQLRPPELPGRKQASGAA